MLTDPSDGDYAPVIYKRFMEHYENMRYDDYDSQEELFVEVLAILLGNGDILAGPEVNVPLEDKIKQWAEESKNDS